MVLLLVGTIDPRTFLRRGFNLTTKGQRRCQHSRRRDPDRALAILRAEVVPALERLGEERAAAARFDDRYDLIKRERMPDGRVKLILKDRSSGEVVQKVEGA